MLDVHAVSNLFIQLQTHWTCQISNWTVVVLVADPGFVRWVKTAEILEKKLGGGGIPLCPSYSPIFANDLCYICPSDREIRWFSWWKIAQSSDIVIIYYSRHRKRFYTVLGIVFVILNYSTLDDTQKLSLESIDQVTNPFGTYTNVCSTWCQKCYVVASFD